MAGTRKGDLKAAATNRRKYGENFYSKIGRKGGRLGHTGGFYGKPELARKWGRVGGRVSKRGPRKNYEFRRSSMT